ncbi:type I pullulanase [Anoxybacter fermentans]|uniref:Type I pullulanase n=1 Tax=Anoxybacter fermentans TaxID=1323375 RepID=A0A3Q9HSF7_9FIRM|nr:type I pullulanase [Anoxybacter fermentans]AZR73422.1 type I pullulanase [Anoxybacter fermentans]
MSGAQKKIKAAVMDNFDEINIVLSEPISLANGEDRKFKVIKKTGEPVALKEITAKESGNGKKFIIRLAEPVDVTGIYKVTHPDFQPKRVFFRKVLDDEQFIYRGDDLGPIYTPEMTRFRVWAPTARRVELIIYDHGDAKLGRSTDMKRDVKGTWVAEIREDLKGKFYTYRVHVHDQIWEAVDPYVKSVNVNGTKGAIIDLKETNPEGWGTVPRPPFKNFVDAIIYETHIRDISVAANSGITHKGKFLALTEENTQSPDGLATGLAHLKELGITHLHLLPIMESEFIIDDKDIYNWGYGTNFFFATEGQYVTDPADPVKRVKEFKEAVQVLHKNGIRVVLDVVYNHTGRKNPDLERIVPGYYLRRDEEGNLYCGSGVNNDFASERPMARKLMIDSVKYWVTEYQVDGFRFDLMGLHDRETMLKIAEELHRIDPTILIYGEAWLLRTGLPFSELMVKNSQQGTSIAIFNDNVRDAIVSGGIHPVTERGFASGKPEMEASIKKAVVGSIIDYDPENVYNREYQFKPEETIHTFNPHETINYVTCHDNYALRDRLERSNPQATEVEREKMAMLANGIVLTCQGIPFIAGGVEIHKTKFGDENSYQSPDYINEIDWSYKKTYYSMFKFYQGLIRLRKEHPAFRMTTAEEIKNHLVFHQSPPGTVVYSLNDHANGDPWKRIVVIYNQNRYKVNVTLPGEGWKVVVEGNKAGITPLRNVSGSFVDVPPISLMVLYQE